MAFAWLEALKSRLEKEKVVRLVANDPALTAELLLLFKVILADGFSCKTQIEQGDTGRRAMELLIRILRLRYNHFHR